MNSVTTSKTQIKNTQAVLLKYLIGPEDYPSSFFKKEFELMKSHNCNNIVKFIDGSCDKGQAWLATEWMDNGVLIDFIEKPLSIETKMLLILDIALAIDYIHEMNLAHQNLSIFSILVSKDYKAKLRGFGFNFPSQNV